jgi:ABC-type transport system involved in multi-copper enzyme maturation permease subunit
MSIPAVPPAERIGKVTQARVALSEWTKLRSVRSTRYSLLATIAFTIGIAAIATAVVSARWPHMDPVERAHFHALEATLAGVNLAQLSLGVLGILVITAEYSTGMIRASLAAVPKRLPVLWAKAGVFGIVALAISIPSVVIAFFVGQSLLSSQHLELAFSAPGVARAVIGAGLYLTVIGLFAVGIGAIVRNTPGAISTFVAIMFVVPPLMNVLPTSWDNAISPYLPSNAGQAVMSITHGAHTLSPWAGFAVFCGYAVAALALGAFVLARRDA